MGTNEKRAVFVEVPDEYAREFKTRCAMYEVTMSSVLRPSIDEFMKTHPIKGQERRMID